MVRSTNAPTSDELCLSPGTRQTAATGLSLPGCSPVAHEECSELAD
jgi:hypothetical protein